MWPILCCCLFLLFAIGAAAEEETGKPQPMTAQFLVGADISMLSKIEKLGGVFRADGQPGDPITIMTRAGCNCFRLRLFVSPDHKEGVINDLDYTLALAKRIHAAGAHFLLDLHYSDTWADPGHQITPAAWSNLDISALEKQVTAYTAEVIAKFKAEGVLPDIVQVGNEITAGMLWPQGKLYGTDGTAEERWDRFTRLVKAGIRGVKQSLGKDDNVRIMIHIDRGADAKGTKWFFDHLKPHDVEFDLIGLSYYPWWHGTLDAVRENLHATAQAYGKDIVVVETAYPYRDPERWPHAKNMAWAISPEGQKQFLSDLIQTVQSTPNGHGLGVIYWYPEALPVQGMEIWYGGANALFDSAGNALPALGAFCMGKPL